MTKITRPEPLPDLTDDSDPLEVIRWKLGYTVNEDHYLTQVGALWPGQYAQVDATRFLEELQAIGSNEAIQQWLDENPIDAEVGRCRTCGRSCGSLTPPRPCCGTATYGLKGEE